MFKLNVNRRIVGEFNTLVECQAEFLRLRDENDAVQGPTDKMHGATIRSAKEKFTISYNTRVWDKEDNMVCDRYYPAETVVEEVEVKKELPAPSFNKVQGPSARQVCDYHFKKTDMEDGAARRALINTIVAEYGYPKASVQSYASNFRAGK